MVVQIFVVYFALWTAKAFLGWEVGRASELLENAKGIQLYPNVRDPLRRLGGCRRVHGDVGGA